VSLRTIVSKFGGTSMGTIESMKKSASIVNERRSNVIVVSATAGTTDRLISLARAASQGDLGTCDKLLFSLKERHSALLEQTGNSDSTKAILEGYYTELNLLVQNLTLLKELTPRAYDHILSLGERMSSLIFRDVLSAALPQKTVLLLDARSIIKTDSNFGKASPDIEIIRKKCASLIEINEKNVYVTQGFIGSDFEGNTTILGRGGSDFSAALFAEGLRASVLEIWTDVAGVATTDPRICQEARIISELSYSEAAEMAQYGAKILHPATIAPAVRASIPVFVGSTFDQDLPGTWIRHTVKNSPEVRAITKRSSQALLTITTPNMYNAYGFMGNIFGIFGRHRISVDCVTTSEISVAVTVDQNTLENEQFLRDLEAVGKVEVETGYTLVSIIGNDLTKRSQLAGRVFGAVDQTKVRMMALGASSYNMNILVKEDEALGCIQNLHRSLICEARA
jgi:aspartate kinase